MPRSGSSAVSSASSSAAGSTSGSSGVRALESQGGSWRERIGYFATGLAVATVLG